MKSFKTIFSVKLTHEYYDLSFRNDFSFVPTEETKQMLRNHRLVFRNTNDGFLVAAEVVGNSPYQLKIPLNDPTKFAFYMVLENARFHNFSRLDLADNNGKTYYFNNLSENIHNVTELLMYPTGGDEFVDDTERIKALPKQFKLDGFAGETVEIKNAIDDSVVFPAEVLNGEVEFDLSQAESGRYDVIDTAGPTVMEELYLDNQFTTSTPIFGVVEILHRTISPNPVPGTYEFITGGDIAPKEYFIKFESRSTKWRYLIGLRTADFISQFDGATISFNVHDDGGNGLTFDPQTTTSNDSEPRIVQIESSAVIPMKQAALQSIQLRDGNDANAVLVANMANSSIDLVVPEANDVSEIYVYV